MMESHLQNNVGDVKSKNSSEEALQRWRKLGGVVKNPTRRYRYTPNLTKRSEAEAMRKTNQQAWKAWKPYFSLPFPLSISLSLSIPTIPLSFAPSISLCSLDLSRLISFSFLTAQQDTSSSSSSPASLQCCPSSSQELFVPLQHPHHLCTAKPIHMRPSLTVAPTAAENLSSGCGDRKFMTESHLQNNFGDVKSKNSSEEALQRWQKLGGIVKNPTRRYRYTANLTKRSEAEAMQKTNQQAWMAWKPYFSLPLPLSISSSLSIPLNLLLPFDPSISLFSLDLSPLISRLFPTSQQDTSSSSSASPSSSSPASLQCYPSSSQEPFVPLQHPHHLYTAKPSHMRPSLTIAPTATEVCIITGPLPPKGKEFYEAPLAKDFGWGSGDVVVLLDDDGEPAPVPEVE